MKRVPVSSSAVTDQKHATYPCYGWRKLRLNCWNNVHKTENRHITKASSSNEKPSVLRSLIHCQSFDWISVGQWYCERGWRHTDSIYSYTDRLAGPRAARPYDSPSKNFRDRIIRFIHWCLYHHPYVFRYNNGNWIISVILRWETRHH